MHPHVEERFLFFHSMKSEGFRLKFLSSNVNWHTRKREILHWRNQFIEVYTIHRHLQKHKFTSSLDPMFSQKCTGWEEKTEYKMHNCAVVAGLKFIQENGWGHTNLSMMHVVQDSSRWCMVDGLPEQPADNLWCSANVSAAVIIGSSDNFCALAFILFVERAAKKFLRASLIQSYRQYLNASSVVSCRI